MFKKQLISILVRADQYISTFVYCAVKIKTSFYLLQKLINQQILKFAMKLDNLRFFFANTFSREK